MVSYGGLRFVAPAYFQTYFNVWCPNVPTNTVRVGVCSSGSSACGATYPANGTGMLLTVPANVQGELGPRAVRATINGLVFF